MAPTITKRCATLTLLQGPEEIGNTQPVTDHHQIDVARLNDGPARWKPAVGRGTFDDGPGQAVFHASSRFAHSSCARRGRSPVPWPGVEGRFDQSMDSNILPMVARDWSSRCA